MASLRGVAAIVGALAGATGAVAASVSDPYASAKESYYNERLLHVALGSIAQMQEPELRVFTRYLAECGDDETSDVGKSSANTAIAAPWTT
jgi:hypothetical protein